MLHIFTEQWAHGVNTFTFTSFISLQNTETFHRSTVCYYKSIKVQQSLLLHMDFKILFANRRLCLLVILYCLCQFDGTLNKTVSAANGNLQLQLHCTEHSIHNNIVYDSYRVHSASFGHFYGTHQWLEWVMCEKCLGHRHNSILLDLKGRHCALWRYFVIISESSKSLIIINNLYEVQVSSWECSKRAIYGLG